MLHKDIPQIVVVQRTPPRYGDSLAQQADPQFELPLLAHQHSQTVQGLGMARLLPQRQAVEGLCLRQLTTLMMLERSPY